MPSFATTQGIRPNEYLYSTVGNQFRTYTLSLSAIIDSVVDNAMANLVDDQGEYYANKGWLLAVITSGSEINKVGPYDASATDGRQTSTNIVGFNDTFSILTDGDVDVGVLYIGTVDKSNVYVEGTLGTTDATIMGYCHTVALDIRFE